MSVKTTWIENIGLLSLGLYINTIFTIINTEQMGVDKIPVLVWPKQMHVYKILFYYDMYLFLLDVINDIFYIWSQVTVKPVLITWMSLLIYLLTISYNMVCMHGQFSYILLFIKQISKVCIRIVIYTKLLI